MKTKITFEFEEETFSNNNYDEEGIKVVKDDEEFGFSQFFQDYNKRAQMDVERERISIRLTGLDEDEIGFLDEVSEYNAESIENKHGKINFKLIIGTSKLHFIAYNVFPVKENGHYGLLFSNWFCYTK